MKYISLISSNIDRVAYVPSKKELRVKFRNYHGRVYVYQAVPELYYRRLLSAASPGHYLKQYIANRFRFVIRRG